MGLLFLSSCGYHLADQSGGAIPEDVHSLAITAVDAAAKPMVQVIHRYLIGKEKEYDIVQISGADAELRLERFSETFSPVGFDAAGVAIAYKSFLIGELSLWREGKRLWSSGMIQVQGDVFAEGGPASIDASRERARDDLRRHWAREAWQRLSSGF